MSPVSSVSSVLTENHEKLVGRANTQSNALRNIKNDCINRIPSKSLPVIVDIFPLLPLFVTIFSILLRVQGEKGGRSWRLGIREPRIEQTESRRIRRIENHQSKFYARSSRLWIYRRIEQLPARCVNVSANITKANELCATTLLR